MRRLPVRISTRRVCETPYIRFGLDFRTRNVRVLFHIKWRLNGAATTPGTPCANQLTSVASNMTHDWLVAGRVDWNLGNNDRFTRIQKEHGLQASITDPINPIFNAQSDQPEYQGQYQ
jgi:hypothetical protein